MQADSVGRWGLRVAGIAGLAIFASFLALTFRMPQWVESVAKDFVAREVARTLNSRIDAIGQPTGDSLLQRAAAEVYRRNAARVEELKERLRDRTRDLFLVALDEVRDLDCPCRERVELWWRGINLAQLAALTMDNQRIRGIIHGGYMSVVDELRQEIRIFTATNAAAFLLLLVVSFARPAASRHLLFPGALLLLATLFCSAIYVFEQDWLFTLIHGQYVGWAYTTYLAVIFLFLLDIALNRGRVTCKIVNGVAGGLGGAWGALTPC